MQCVAERERTLGSSNRAGWGVTYTAWVRIRVGDVIREGSGAGHGIDADLGQAHESAIKETETDAMKRALTTFGNPFGLALYDKQQRENASAQPDAEQRLEPLDPATIQQILATVRGLPRPALEGFTKACRKRFQVPADAPSIADRICQRGITTGSRRFWCRTYRCARQTRTVRCAQQSNTRLRLERRGARSSMVLSCLP